MDDMATVPVEKGQVKVRFTDTVEGFSADVYCRKSDYPNPPAYGARYTRASEAKLANAGSDPSESGADPSASSGTCAGVGGGASTSVVTMEIADEKMERSHALLTAAQRGDAGLVAACLTDPGCPVNGRDARG